MKPNFICDLNQFKFIRVLGEKAAAFLQGQLTCDIREVTPHQSRLGAHCNHKGKVLISLRVLQFQGDFYLEVPQNMQDFTLQQLTKIAAFSKVSLEITELKSLGCYGAEIDNALSSMMAHLPTLSGQVSTFQEMIIIRTEGAEPGYEVIGSIAAIDCFKQGLSGLIPITQDQQPWRCLDIENGIAWIYPETQDLFTPHMLNLPQLNAVSFKKGCYVGQEIIARTHYLGKTKRQLVNIILKANQSPQPGDKLFNEAMREIGIVVNAAGEDVNRFQILAVVQNC